MEGRTDRAVTVRLSGRSKRAKAHNFRRGEICAKWRNVVHFSALHSSFTESNMEKQAPLHPSVLIGETPNDRSIRPVDGISTPQITEPSLTFPNFSPCFQSIFPTLEEKMRFYISDILTRCGCTEHLPRYKFS